MVIMPCPRNGVHLVPSSYKCSFGSGALTSCRDRHPEWRRQEWSVLMPTRSDPDRHSQPPPIWHGRNRRFGQSKIQRHSCCSAGEVCACLPPRHDNAVAGTGLRLVEACVGRDQSATAGGFCMRPNLLASDSPVEVMMPLMGFLGWRIPSFVFKLTKHEIHHIPRGHISRRQMMRNSLVSRCCAPTPCRISPFMYSSR